MSASKGLQPQIARADDRKASFALDSKTGEMSYHQGVDYKKFIAFASEVAGARNYLEIGTRDGSSLVGIKCPTIAIDPELSIQTNAINTKKKCLFFQMSSDAFFASEDPSLLFGAAIQLAFLDGMHHFEFLLRDFINTELHSASDALIMLHDCFPVNLEMAERVFASKTRRSKRAKTRVWWTGDVWKLLPILRQYRPDIELISLDCKPTGLVVCRNLNPQSTILSKYYHTIIGEYHSITLADYGLHTLYRQFPRDESAILMDPIRFKARLCRSRNIE